MTLPRVFAGRQRWRLASLLANGLGQAGGTIGLALVVRHVVDAVMASPQPSVDWQALSLGIPLVLLLSWLRRRERIDREGLAQSYAHRVRRALYRRLSAMTPAELRGASRGTVLLRFLGDLTALSNWIGRGLARSLISAIVIVGTLSALALASWQVVALVTAILAAGSALTLLTGRHLDEAATQAARRRARLANNIVDKLTALPTVRLLGRGRDERRRMLRQSQRLRDAVVERAGIAGTVMAMAELTALGATLGTLAAGAWAVERGLTSAGMVVGLMTIVGMLVNPLRDLGRAWEYWRRAEQSRRSIEKFLREPAGKAMRRARGILPAGPGALALHGLSLPGIATPLDAAAPAGARVVVTGSALAAKRALAHVLAGLERPSAGRVELDGTDLSSLAPADLARAVRLAGPAMGLVRGTVAENLRYAEPEASGESVDRCLARADASGLLAGLADGGSTVVAHDGANLAPEQQRRLLLARALLGTPRLLVIEQMDAPDDAGWRAAISRLLEEHPATIVLVTEDPLWRARATVTWSLGGDGLLTAEAPRPLRVVAP